MGSSRTDRWEAERAGVAGDRPLRQWVKGTPPQVASRGTRVRVNCRGTELTDAFDLVRLFSKRFSDEKMKGPPNGKSGRPGAEKTRPTTLNKKTRENGGKMTVLCKNGGR